MFLNSSIISERLDALVETVYSSENYELSHQLVNLAINDENIEIHESGLRMIAHLTRIYGIVDFQHLQIIETIIKEEENEDSIEILEDIWIFYFKSRSNYSKDIEPYPLIEALFHCFWINNNYTDKNPEKGKELLEQMQEKSTNKLLKNQISSSIEHINLFKD